MSKRYRLLKSLPDADIGTILENNDGLYRYKGRTDQPLETSWYVKEVVENNPEWFEEIEQPKREPQPTDKEFKWTDELVADFFGYAWVRLQDGKILASSEIISKFKSSKQSNSAREENSLTLSQFNGTVRINDKEYFSEQDLRDAFSAAIDDAIGVIRKNEFDGDWEKLTYPSTVISQLEQLKSKKQN